MGSHMVCWHVFQDPLVPNLQCLACTLPSISVLTLGLKLADIVDPDSSMYNCTQLYCFNPHESCAPLIG